jgi:hypothetical protein
VISVISAPCLAIGATPSAAYEHYVKMSCEFDRLPILKIYTMIKSAFLPLRFCTFYLILAPILLKISCSVIAIIIDSGRP